MFREFSKRGSFRLFYSRLTNTSHDHVSRFPLTPPGSRLSPHHDIFTFLPNCRVLEVCPCTPPSFLRPSKTTVNYVYCSRKIHAHKKVLVHKRTAWVTQKELSAWRTLENHPRAGALLDAKCFPVALETGFDL